MAVMDLSGLWACEIPGQAGTIRIPGTLDEAGIGFPDPPEKQWKAEEVRRIGFYRDGDPIVTRLTRKVSFEGAAGSPGMFLLSGRPAPACSPMWNAPAACASRSTVSRCSLWNRAACLRPGPLR